MIHKKRDEIQNLAVNAWVKADMKGTLELSTGMGKTFCFIKATALLPDNSNILFLAETSQREIDIRADIEKFKTLFNYDLLQTHELTFMCYQSAYKTSNTEWDLVVADEIHTSLTHKYSEFYYNNSYKAILGLSATVDKNAIVSEEDNKTITKGDLLNEIAPVCYTYSLNQAQEDNTTRKLNVYVIMHRLDSVNKTIEAGSKLKRFKTTEKAAYNYWDNEFKKALFMPESIKEFKIRTSSAARAKVLYQLPSKIESTKELLKHLPDKTIVFSNDVDSLLKVVKNVVSSKNSKLVNEKIRKDFDDNKITHIGSFKMLTQGANLKDLDNVILMSYFSTELTLIQQLGRLRVKDKEGNVFIFCTIGTVEEKWFNKMIENINLNITYCKDVNDCINKIK